MLANTPYSYETPAITTTTGTKKQSNIELGNGSTEMDVDDEQAEQTNGSYPDDISKEPLYIEFIRFLNLLLEISLDSEFSPRSLVSVTVLEQIILCLRQDSHKFLQFLPFHLLDGIIRSTFDVLTYEQLLAYLSLDNSRARKTGAKMLCQLQVQKGNTA